MCSSLRWKVRLLGNKYLKVINPLLETKFENFDLTESLDILEIISKAAGEISKYITNVFKQKNFE